MKFLIKSHNLNLIAILKLKINRNNVNKVSKRLDFDSWLSVEGEGMNGSIWVLWNKSKNDTVQLKLDPNSNHMRVNQ